jgi:hypothetical protein
MANPAEDLPPEGERLLAVAPEEFVAERARVAGELREAGRKDEAQRVADLRKPPLVVLAVNRGARDRPQAARDAADAAERVRKAQLSGDADAYREAREDLERASAMLAEVAVARLSRGKQASDTMRRRVNDLLRAATADDGARDALVRGALVEELEAPGFAPFEGVSFGGSARRGAKTPERDRREERRRAREQELQEELARARGELRAAERALAEATRERVRAERAVASIEAKLDRL